jgi:hypothetical protein
VGLAVAYFAMRHDLPPRWRLFAITGFWAGSRRSRRFPRKSPSFSCRRLLHGLALAADASRGLAVLTAAGFATFRALAA